MVRKHFIYLFLFTSIFFITCQKEDSISERDYKTLGSSANDLLSASNYTSLLIEIDYMSGYEPDAATLNNLKNFLNTHLNKPAGIQITQKQIANSARVITTLDDVVRIERKYRTIYTGGNTITVHVLITDSYYSDTSNFALSYWNTSICLFGKNIYNHSGGAGQVSRINLVSTLLQHEFGHLFGLVDQGSPMQMAHLDTDNGAHCNNISCLMYYAIETHDGIPMSNSIPLLDDNCKRDLKANGGK